MTLENPMFPPTRENDALTFPKPRSRRRRLVTAATRRRIEDAVEKLIDVLDAIEAPSEDLEDDDPAEEDDPGEDDGTGEPSLGSFDRLMNQEHGWTARSSVRWWVIGYDEAELDRSDYEDGGDAEPDVDGEPWLGANEPLEPPRGALILDSYAGRYRPVTAADRAAVYDQSSWSSFSNTLDREDDELSFGEVGDDHLEGDELDRGECGEDDYGEG